MGQQWGRSGINVEEDICSCSFEENTRNKVCTRSLNQKEQAMQMCY